MKIEKQEEEGRERKERVGKREGRREKEKERERSKSPFFRPLPPTQMSSKVYSVSLTSM